MKVGWKEKRLGDICKTSSGGTPLKSHKEYYEGGSIPWLLSGEVSQGDINESRNFITTLGLEKSSAKLFPKNTVLVAMYGATAGQVGLLKFEASTNQAVCGILPNESMHPKYLYYCFLSKKDLLISQAVGGAQPNISQEKIKNTFVPHPPLPEQKRIVKILDEAFASIDKAKANAEKNLQNSKELFDSYLQSIFEKGGDDWEEKTLGDICHKIQDGAHHSPKKLYTEKSVGKYLYITSKNIRNNYVDLSKIAYVDEDFHNSIYPRCMPELGDILLTKDGANTGNITINTIDEPFSLLSSVCLIKPVKSVLNSEFLKYYIQSPTGFKILTGKMTGAAIKRIILKTIKSTTLKFPSLDKQNKIVSEMNDMLFITNQLSSICLQKISSLNELKKSILQKAFSGQL